MAGLLDNTPYSVYADPMQRQNLLDVQRIPSSKMGAVNSFMDNPFLNALTDALSPLQQNSLPRQFGRFITSPTAIKDFAVDTAQDLYQSAQIPKKALTGQYKTQGDVLNAANQFGFDFGLLPALGTAAIAKPAANVLRSAGGVDSLSGGTPRGRDVDDLGFYSKLLEEARNLRQAKGTGEQIKNSLLGSGVKQQEIDFTPELQGLLSQPKVTREELVGLLEENRIRPVQITQKASEGEGNTLNFGDTETLDAETYYGSGYSDNISDKLDYEGDIILEDFIARHGSDYTEAELKDISEDFLTNGVKNLDGDVQNKLYDLSEQRLLDSYYSMPTQQVFDPETGYTITGNEDFGFEIIDDGGRPVGSEDSLNEAIVQANYHAEDSGLIGSGAGNTRFIGLTEDGGENYKEILLTIPEYEGKTKPFVATGHFEDEDLIVHARTTDRNTDTGMQDVLYVEELQSDFAQRGYKRGFDTPKNKAKFEILQAQIKPIQEKLNVAADANKDFEVEIYNKIADKLGGMKMTKEQFSLSSSYPNMFTPDRDRLLSAMDLSDFFRGRKVGTLTRNWKRVILDPDNFDGIDVTTKWQDNNFKVRSARDDLDNVDKGFRADMEIAPFVDDSKKTTELIIKRLINQAIQENKKYLAFSPSEIQMLRWGETEGVRNLYDKTIPSVAKKIAKSLDPDAKVGNIFLDNVEEIGANKSMDRFSIEITPKMKQNAIKGQPLFTAPNVPTPLTGLLSDDKPQRVKYDPSLI